jgi:molybdopterin converting factor small subunit
MPKVLKNNSYQKISSSTQLTAGNLKVFRSFDWSAGYPKPMKINVSYRDKLIGITGKIGEVIEIAEGSTSGDFINLLQEIYPEIFERFKPGYLGFELNNRMIEASQVLKDGDSYVFCTWGVIKNEWEKNL